MLNQKLQEIMNGHIEGGDVCRIAPDGDSEGCIIIDVLLTSHQRQERQGIGLKRVRHGPKREVMQGQVTQWRVILYGSRDTSTPQPNIPET
jgi:hypothetical protein